MQEMQEMRVGSLGWEDSLEQEMATHSSILVWRIPWTEEPIELQSMGSQRVRHNWGTKQQQIKERVIRTSFVVQNIFCFIDYPKAFDCVDHKKLENY